MQEYYFLFGLAFVYTIFATLQDLKTREVANWLNFSLIAFALAYRAFYSAVTKNFSFFIIGLAGFAIFFIFAYLLYYSKTFAGGDAKLLMGYGIIMPFPNFSSLIPLSLTFIIILFIVGTIYSLIYSFFILLKNKKKFKKEFFIILKKNRVLVILSLFLFVLFVGTSYFYDFLLPLSFIFLFPWIYFYTKSIDKCMIKIYPYQKLTVGDWLEKDIKINSKITIKKTVHGLSQEDIKILKKYKKNVLIKEGIPFTPSFLFSLIIMVFFFSAGLFSQNSQLSFLFYFFGY